MKSDKVDCEFFDIVSKINSIIIYKANFEESPVKVFLDTLIALLHKKCKNLGFDFYKCMLQTIKEIESRTGYYDEEKSKFIKDLGAYDYDEAVEKACKDFEFLNNATSCYLLKENENFWYIACEDDYKGRYKEYTIKKWYKADYESCRLLKC
ncbi:TPA: hypothetical protein ACH6IR_000328 [Campylobacter jejuni]